MARLFRRLAPVGEPIVLAHGRPIGPGDFGVDRSAVFVDSGTSALAIAMAVAKARRGMGADEVILPGYGCPDLVAAAHFAGLTPRLVDFDSDCPGYDLAQLRAAVDERTIAIVTVNFLGIPDRLDEIASIASGVDALLIEDDAQWYARSAEARHYRGDLVVHSFGRGKPVSLLGGGALLSTPVLTELVHQQLTGAVCRRASCARWQMQAALYNLLLAPSAYGFVALLPFLQIGVTRYHALSSISCIDDCRRQRLAVNLDRYCRRDRQVQQLMHEMLDAAAGSGFVDLPAQFGGLGGDLLRYPLLCPDRTVRDRIYRALERAGLGASILYAAALPAVDGVSGCEAGPLPHAELFADRLLTLPLTGWVSPAMIDRIGGIIARG